MRVLFCIHTDVIACGHVGRLKVSHVIDSRVKWQDRALSLKDTIVELWMQEVEFTITALEQEQGFN